MSLNSLILTVRTEKVFLNADLAQIYGVETKRLNEQVKRNSSPIFSSPLNSPAKLISGKL